MDKRFITDLDYAVNKSKQRWYSFGTVNWGYILKTKLYSEYEIESYKDSINWDKVWKYQKLSKPFLIKYRSRVNFTTLSYNPHLTPELINEFIDDICLNDSPWYWNLNRIVRNPKTSPSTIAAIISIDSSEYAYATNEILRNYRFKDKVIELITFNAYGTKKDILSQDYILSPTFMVKHKNALNWKLISRHQPLTLKFIEGNETCIKWDQLGYNKHLTYDIVMKYRNQLPFTEEIENIIKRNQV